MNENSGKPWSEMEITNLQFAVANGGTVEQIADLLMRDVEEVRQKLAELQTSKRD